MKKILSIVCLLLLSWGMAIAAPKNAQTADQEDTKSSVTDINRLSIGLRGGVASFLPKTVANATERVGGDILFDLQYAHYWVREHDNQLGLLVGVSAGYSQGGLNKNQYLDHYTVTDPDGWKADYTVSADKIIETDHQVQLEFPVMLAIVHHSGLFVNFGPRFLLPLYTPYNQQLENPVVDAYFEKTDVLVHNEVITGLWNNDELDTKGKTQNNFKLNITLGLELGYEWKFKNDHSLGLGAYVNYAVYSMFYNDTNAALPFIEVTPAIPSVVMSQSATASWTQKLGYVDGGIKIAYHFNWLK